MWDRRPTPRRGGDRDAEMRSERERGRGREKERERERVRERYEVDVEMHLGEVAAASSRRRGRSVRHCRISSSGQEERPPLPDLFVGEEHLPPLNLVVATVAAPY
jgi:hypothetical protein